jgi:hypothetical protein
MYCVVSETVLRHGFLNHDNQVELDDGSCPPPQRLREWEEIHEAQFGGQWASRPLSRTVQ